jgi:hypothetical protein
MPMHIRRRATQQRAKAGKSLGTGDLSAPDCVKKSLKWSALRRFPLLAGAKMAARRHGNVNVDWPWLEESDAH